MNETTTSPFILVLLFILRCLIPLGILFGISYLLRRLELIIEHSDEATQEQTSITPPAHSETVVSAPKKHKNTSKKKNTGGIKKKKPTTSKKKES